MQNRNLPILFLILVFAGFLLGIYRIKRYEPVVSIVPAAHVERQQWKSFTGRVAMPAIDDMYVLENSAGRDLTLFESFLQGRAAGLHWAAAEHFKKERCPQNADSSASDVALGVKLTLDSLGEFTPEILFSNTSDVDLKNRVLSHIRNYWRYPRSEDGVFEVWVPIVWKACYK